MFDQPARDRPRGSAGLLVLAAFLALGVTDRGVQSMVAQGDWGRSPRLAAGGLIIVTPVTGLALALHILVRRRLAFWIIGPVAWMVLLIGLMTAVMAHAAVERGLPPPLAWDQAERNALINLAVVLAFHMAAIGLPLWLLDRLKGKSLAPLAFD